MPGSFFLSLMQQYPPADREIGELITGSPVARFKKVPSEPFEVLSLFTDVMKIDWHENSTRQRARAVKYAI